MTEPTYICASGDLTDDTSRGYRLEAVNLLLVRKKGRVYAYRNLCPHVAIPLEWREHDFLTADTSLIQCANHGALFTIEDGLCISGPCNGQSLLPIAVTERDGGIYLDENT